MKAPEISIVAAPENGDARISPVHGQSGFLSARYSLKSNSATTVNATPASGTYHAGSSEHQTSLEVLP
jgi:hypothetical protein